VRDRGYGHAEGTAAEGPTMLPRGGGGAPDYSRFINDMSYTPRLSDLQG
jgi:hypothetical protein